MLRLIRADRWIIMALLAISPMPSNAASAPASIRVVLDDNYPPYSFRDDAEQAQGILKDLWELWQQRTGIAVDFQPMEWGQARAVMESGKADVIDTIFQTEERRQTLDFSKPYTTIAVPLFFHKTISGITDAGSLKGFTVGVKSGDACSDFLRARGITDLKVYPSYESQISAAVRQEVRIVCADESPAYYFFARAGAENEFRRTAALYTGQFHWAVAKGNDDLKRVIAGGFARITADERADIEKRWLGEALPARRPAWLAYARHVLFAAALLLVASLVWNWALLRQVVARTRQLSGALAKLQESENRLLTILDNVDAYIYLKDTEGRYLFANAPCRRLWNAGIEDIVGHTDEKFFGGPAHTRRNDRHVLIEGTMLRTEQTHTAAETGRTATHLSTELPLRGEDGAIYALCGISVDITDRVQMEEALRDRESRYRILIDRLPLAIQVFAPDGTTLRVNQAWERMWALSASALEHYNVLEDRQLEEIGMLPLLKRSFAGESVVLPIHAYDKAQAKGVLSAGGKVWLRAFAYPVSEKDGRLLEVVLIQEDVTESKRAEDEIRHLAFYDPLTRLPNRRLVLDRLQQALTSSTRHKRHGALMLLDMDDFKTLNDTLGHDVGDRFLVEVASRLLACVREGDTVARQGGDEFVVILEDLNEDTLAAMQAESVAVKIHRAISQPYLLDLGAPGGIRQTRSYHCTSSIGITLFRDNTVAVDELMKRADTAMYQAKAAGRNTLRFFDPQMQAVVTARAAIENDLQEAVRERQFLLYYQPQVDSTGRVAGAEALVRWQHPGRGVVPPDEFIPIAEATDLIQSIGHWVLETACAQLVAWAAQPGTSHLTLAVNVSARQFRHPDFVDRVRELLDSSGAEPKKLKLELTESLLLDDVEDVIAKMSILKAKGVGFALDDFGTGYSSLSYLKRLPLDQLKIDRSFVRDLLTDSNDAAIARTIVTLAQAMGLAVIAEGVETAAQREFLAAQGCHTYQGYLFGAPVPIDGFEPFVRQV